MANVSSGIENLSQSSVIDKVCQFCGETTQQTFTSSILHQPKIMVLCINRFCQLQNDTIGKNDTVVFCDPTIALPNVTGKLVGMVMHTGRATTSGHYTALVRSDNVWYSCNDTAVHIISDNDNYLHSREVYLLFYVKD